jgi:ABC-type nitrate/sulfonate/bicarbonate transport system substrate-binding protein
VFSTINKGGEMITMYNHMFDVAFTVDTETADPNKVTVDEMLKGLEKRIQYLRDNPEEAMEAFGYSDTYDYEA